MRCGRFICVIICLFVAITLGYSQQTIHDAAKQGNLAVVEQCLKKGISVDALDKDGQTPLMWSAVMNHLDVVKLLVDSGANVNIGRNKDGETALMFASFKGHKEVVQYLTEKGANVMS